MDVLERLQKDHDALKRLFRSFDEAEGTPHAQRELFAQIREELELHERLEDQIFYPAIRKAGSGGEHDRGKDLVAEAREAHREVEQLVGEVAALSAERRTYSERVARLRSAVERHVTWEEREMFPFARTHLSSERLLELGGRLSNRRRELSRRDPHAAVDLPGEAPRPHAT